MSLTSLDNVAIGMMLLLAFLGIIIVVYHCAKLEKRIEKLEGRTNKIEDLYSPARLEILEALNGVRFDGHGWSFRYPIPTEEEITKEFIRINGDPGPSWGRRGAYVHTRFSATLPPSPSWRPTPDDK